MPRKRGERPGGIVWTVGGQAEFGTGLHHTMQLQHRRLIQKTALGMTALGPWIGIKNVDPADRGRGETIQKRTHVRIENTDIGKVFIGIGDCAQQLGYSVEKMFSANEPDVRMVSRQFGQVLTAAKADLKP